MQVDLFTYDFGKKRSYFFGLLLFLLLIVVAHVWLVFKATGWSEFSHVRNNASNLVGVILVIAWAFFIVCLSSWQITLITHTVCRIEKSESHTELELLLGQKRGMEQVDFSEANRVRVIGYSDTEPVGWATVVRQGFKFTVFSDQAREWIERLKAQSNVSIQPPHLS